MIFEHFPVAPLGCNCVIVGDELTKDAIVIDPGGEPEKIMGVLAKHGLRCVAMLHTHTHFDHVGATADIQANTGAIALLHEADMFLYRGLQMQLDTFGVPWRAPGLAQIDRFLGDGDPVGTGSIEITTLHTPGHTPGSLCFAIAGEHPIVVAGDTLFRESIGRTDLWGGDSDTILRSIRNQLLALPDETLVITGHGESTTIGHERDRNPFVGKGSKTHLYVG